MDIVGRLDAYENFDDRISYFKKMIEECQKIVFFGGAGVSTGSGIPDFRSEDGLYKNIDKEFSQYTPEYYLSSECFNHNPKIFYKYYRAKMDARDYKPNSCHLKLAELEKEGKMLGVVTQNIDMLHEDAGSTKIYKLHGTIGKNHCIKCGEEYGIDMIFDNTDVLPRCPKCKANYNLIKPNVVLYGENLPKDAFNGAMDIIPKGDLLIVAGTSLQVEPAASMVSYFEGKYIVVINREPIPLETYADCVFREDICKVFDSLNG